MSQSNVYGYIRVSTREQNEDRQLIALRAFPVEDSHIFLDKLSGKDFNRPQYKKLVKKMQEGDLLVIKSIDRLGRNYEEIQNQWRKLTKEKKVDIVVLDMPLLDTRKKEKNLTGTFIADLVLQILSYVAQTERENIKQRQREGIAAAKQRGVKFGRPRKEIPVIFPDVDQSWKKGEINSRQAARLLSISQDTFLRWSREAAQKAEKQKRAPGTVEAQKEE